MNQQPPSLGVGVVAGVLAGGILVWKALSRWPGTTLRWIYPLRLRGVDVLLALFCWILLTLGGSDPAKLSEADLLSIKGFSDRLLLLRRAEPPNLASRLWDGLSPSARAVVEQAAAGKPFSEAEMQSLIDDVNAALLSKTLVDEADAAQGLVPPPLREVLDSERDVVDSRQLARLNRLALERAFPGMIAGGVRSLFQRAAIRSTLSLILIPLVLWRLARIPLHQLGIHGRRWSSYAFFGVASALLYGPITFVMNILVRGLAPQETLNPAQEYLLGAHGPLDWLLLGYTAVVAAPLLEELLFRAVLQGWLIHRLGQLLTPRAGGILGLVIASILFGLAHGSSWPDPIPLTFLAVGLGITYQRTRSLWAPAAMHATFNGVMLVLGVVYGD